MGKWFLVLLIPVFRFLLNLNNVVYLRDVLKWHNKYLDGKVKNATGDKKKISEKAARWIQANALEIKRRVINAGVTDQIKSYMEPIGLNYARKVEVSALDNLLFMNTELIQTVRDSILRAKGYYWVQAWLSFSPLFWIETIIFLPREILEMAGFYESSRGFQTSVKVVQLIYWAVSIFYIIKFLSQ